MDLIYTNSKRIDLGVIGACAFDLSYGDEENDFELAVGEGAETLEFGSCVYIEGTEYGGIVDGIRTSTVDEKTVYLGRTWHGILNSKVIEPDAGESHLIVSGDAHECLQMLVDRFDIGNLFAVESGKSGINVENYKFHRYCKGYDGIRAMLAACGAKLKITWSDRSVFLSAVPLIDYSTNPVDGDEAPLSVEKYANKVNHLVCLGRELLEGREIVHLYVDQFGRIGDVQYYTGLDEVMDTYDYSNIETVELLRDHGVERLRKLRDKDSAEISINEDSGAAYDIGDIIGATEERTGVSVSAVVAQKIVKINTATGVIKTEYRAGG